MKENNLGARYKDKNLYKKEKCEKKLTDLSKKMSCYLSINIKKYAMEM